MSRGGFDHSIPVNLGRGRVRPQPAVEDFDPRLAELPREFRRMRRLDQGLVNIPANSTVSPIGRIYAGVGEAIEFGWVYFQAHLVGMHGTGEHSVQLFTEFLDRDSFFLTDATSRFVVTAANSDGAFSWAFPMPATRWHLAFRNVAAFSAHDLRYIVSILQSQPGRLASQQ